MVEDYDARLRRLVERFERDCAHIRRIHGRPHLHNKRGRRLHGRGKRNPHDLSWSQIYDVVAFLDPEPANYRRIAEVLRVGDPLTPWRIAACLCGLERRGFLRVVGRGPAQRFGPGHGAKLYEWPTASRAFRGY